MTEDKTTTSPLQARVLALLLLAYIFNFLDRQILGILAGPIIEDLKLDDAQFGAIGGLAFALLYSILGVPLALLADRTSRSKVIAGAVAVWSAFTALCGTATGFGQLFFYRLGVGVGEAGGVAPSYALIADYFPPQRRARALGDLLTGHSTRPCGRNPDRRLSGRLDRLARRLPGDGCRRAPAGTGDPVLRSRRAPQNALAGARDAASPDLFHHRPQADLLADGIRGLMQLARRLWPRAVDSVGAGAQLRTSA